VATSLIGIEPGAGETAVRYAAPGTVFIYHVGFLAEDRRELRLRLHPLASRMLLLWQRGLVHLVARKLAECEYEYLAVRKRTRAG
jgi:hypothetical protein